MEKNPEYIIIYTTTTTTRGVEKERERGEKRRPEKS